MSNTPLKKPITDLRAGEDAPYSRVMQFFADIAMTIGDKANDILSRLGKK